MRMAPCCVSCGEPLHDEPGEGCKHDEDHGETDVDDDVELDFADPGGRSALRAATADDPRIHPCPTCGSANRLTLRDIACGYQCDACADSAEGYGP